MMLTIFTAVTAIHILGAILSVATCVYGALMAIKRQGNMTRLKNVIQTLVVVQTLSGVGMVLLQPTSAVVSRACISGLSLYAVFAIVYFSAKQRVVLSERA